MRKNYEKNLILKDRKGITLIALVITIIVLLVLAGVSISTLAGQDGILNKAVSAKEAVSDAEDYEGVVLATQTALIGNRSGKVDLADNGKLEKALGNKYNYLGDGIIEKDGKYYTVGEDGTVIKGGVKVGDIIAYTPPSVTDAKWSAEYSGLKNSNASATDTVLNNTLDVSNTNSFKVTSWRVLSIEDGKVNLISENSTTGKVYLGNANGYNNAVKLLNDTCNTLYGDTSKGITGRSIKIEDIEGLMTEEGLNSVYSYTNAYTNLVKYGEQDTSLYTEYNYYPTIYAEEKLSVINGVKNQAGLGKSEQNEYFTGSTQPLESIQPYQTYWSKSATDMKTYLGGDESVNYKLIMPEQNGTMYWIASRSVDIASEFCGYAICSVESGKIECCMAFASDIGPNGNDSLALRPIVSLSTELLTYDEVNKTWSVK